MDRVGSIESHYESLGGIGEMKRLTRLDVPFQGHCLPNWEDHPNVAP
jgi:hypothetical protein